MTEPNTEGHPWLSKNVRKFHACHQCQNSLFSPFSKSALKCKPCNITIHKTCLPAFLADDTQKSCADIASVRARSSAPSAGGKGKSDDPSASPNASSPTSDPDALYKDGDVVIIRDPSAEFGARGLPRQWEMRLRMNRVTKEEFLADPSAYLATLKNTLPGGAVASAAEPMVPAGLEVLPLEQLVAPETPEAVFTDIRKIGEGAYGTVYVCTVKTTGRPVAVKVVDVQEKTVREMVAREVSVMKWLQREPHANLVRFYNVWRNPPGPAFTEVWIAMEYVRCGTLFQALKAHGPLPEPVIAFVAQRCLSALAYMHRLGFVHRDIKSDNVLVATGGVVKLADYGNCALVEDGRSTMVGTPYWMAPEVIGGDMYDAMADMWSFGILVMELAEGEPPLYAFNGDRVLFQIMSRPAPVLDAGGSYTAELRDFVSLCVVKDPAGRTPAAELLQHPFLKNMCSEAEFDRLIDAAVDMRK
eukprot:TRINITY_DN24441_c0_g1_i1.p1 TRINITY_DN24441_c0_g1~~TRINITY_DN24441_c0_g1_i1.p1  ORF type:complete len:472 (-),score=84.70 TRINITY_DN24441_c0_g1_i1:387-1802(-)